MKERILRNWNPRRVLYAALGGIAIVNGIMQREWAGVMFGAYFAAMGVFAFGCAGGACGISRHPRNSPLGATQDVGCEELK